MINVLKGIFAHISWKRRYQFIGLLFLTIFGSLAEMLSLSAVIPFIGILTQPEEIFNNDLFSTFIKNFNIESPNSLVLPITIFFCICALLAGLMRLLLLWSSINISNSTGADLSKDVYKKTLFQPYKVHISRNTSEIISGITQKVNNATSAISSLITVVTSILLMLAILVTLLIIDPFIASVSLISFSIVYFLIAFFTRIRLKKNSNFISISQIKVVKSLQEGLGAIRDILLDNNQLLFTKEYGKNVVLLQKSLGENQYITLAPRFVMEALGMVLIAFFAYLAVSLTKGTNDLNSTLPVLAALALAAQRLLPLLQQVYGNWSAVLGSIISLQDVLDLLNQPLPDRAGIQKKVVFDKDIELKELSFKYENDKEFILEKVNIKFKKGSKIGIIGETGSGKSTLIDLLMGLLIPTKGELLIDRKILNDGTILGWQSNISHVPQDIFLIDESIERNITFGFRDNEIDKDKIDEVIDRALLREFVDSSPYGLSLQVGEKGVRLSGGQKQRIGLARALYKNPSVLILDEATSALDNETEEKVISSLNSLNNDVTIFMIAHRLSTLKFCDKIIEIKAKKINDLGSYDQFIGSV